MDISIPYYEDNTRISNSALGWFLNKGPAFFHAKLSGEVEEEKTSAMDRGTMIHMFLLQPEEFQKTYVVWTGNKPSSANQDKFVQAYINSVEIEPNKALISAYRSSYSVSSLSDEKVLQKAKEMANSLSEYIEFMRHKDRELISPYELSILNAIKENVQSHKLAKELLYPKEGETKHEFHINWDYLELPCKSLLDSVNFDYEHRICTLMDIKTTVKIGHFEDSVNQYDYTRQLMFYTLALQWYIENELKDDYGLWKFEWYIIAIDTVDKNEVRVFKFKDLQLSDAFVRIKNTMQELSWHYKTNKWDHHRAYYEGDGSETLELN